MIDDRVPQQPVEPRHRAVLVADLASAGEAADERILKDVLRLRTRPHTLLQEGEEPAMVRHEYRDYRGIGWRTGITVVSFNSIEIGFATKRS